MKAALAPGGILEGGDWPEGWQYGPLAVTSYALAARVARRAGIPVEGVDVWLAAMLKRHVYGLSPVDKVYAGGDTEAESAHLDPAVNTLNAMALGDASPDTKRWAKGELSRLKLVDADYLLHDALATVGEKPARVPRATCRPGTSRRRRARSTRGPVGCRGVWFVAECSKTLDIDHGTPRRHLSCRGQGRRDRRSVAVWSLSTLRAMHRRRIRAPAAEYIPSQGLWGERAAGWGDADQEWRVAARRYADQYKFQHRPSESPRRCVTSSCCRASTGRSRCSS